MNGLELQWQQAFGSSGFGTVVNFTYTDAKTGAVAGGAQAERDRQFEEPDECQCVL
ncbi:hypothetical protein [Massilia eburnea]|uniref:hypothetical protein n=1 Tax=Massilia eburnea TaxID=1776165 RepID=UPI003D6B863C